MNSVPASQHNSGSLGWSNPGTDYKTSSRHHTADPLPNSNRKRTKKTMKRLLTDLVSTLK